MQEIGVRRESPLEKKEIRQFSGRGTRKLFCCLVMTTAAHLAFSRFLPQPATAGEGQITKGRKEKTEQKDLFDREREGKQKELCLRYVDRIEKVRAFT